MYQQFHNPENFSALSPRSKIKYQLYNHKIIENPAVKSFSCAKQNENYIYDTEKDGYNDSIPKTFEELKNFKYKNLKVSKIIYRSEHWMIDDFYIAMKSANDNNIPMSITTDDKYIIVTYASTDRDSNNISINFYISDEKFAKLPTEIQKIILDESIKSSCDLSKS